MDPKVTQQYLLGQAGVVDAAVWLEQGEMRAEVTLLDPAELTPQSLRLQCACELGLQFTPRSVVCLSMRPRAA